MPSYVIENGPELLRFAIYCTVAGGMVFLIDLLACKIRSTQSLLGIVYRRENSLALFLLWSLGSGLMGALGAYAEVFQLTKTSVITVGIAWPFLLSKVIRTSINGVDGDVEHEVDGEENEQQ